MKRHTIKIWPDYFRAVCLKRKTFELRKNDRNYEPGDLVTMKEWDPVTRKYTGSKISATIGWMARINGDQAVFSLIHVGEPLFKIKEDPR
jgi:hypothetical protein